MLKPLVSLLFSLFTLQTLFANSNQTIITVMNFDDAKNILAKSNCTSQTLQKIPPEPPSKVADYEIPDNRLLEIMYDSGTNKIVSLAIAEIPSKKNRRWIKVDKVTIAKNDFKKYLLIADKEAEKSLAEEGKTGRGPFLLQNYRIEIREFNNAGQEIIELKYTSGVPVNFRGHPRNFSIWVYKISMKVKVFKGA